MSLSDIENMPQREKDEFTRCCALLMAKTFVPRDTPDGRLSRDYSFIQNKFSQLEEYLSLSGWKLYNDRTLGIIYVSNAEEYNRLTLNKLTTQVTVTLRLMFEERRMNGTSVYVVGVTVGELLAKMINELSVLQKKPAQKEDAFDMHFDCEDIDTINGYLIYKMGKIPQDNEQFECTCDGYSFRVLEDHNIIYRMGDSYENMECQIKVLPSILLAVPNNRCKAICEILQDENKEAENENSDEDTAYKLALLHE